jgi:hypothetical protein
VFVNGFNPAEGDSFEILSAGTLSGSFDTTNLAALDPGLSWQVDYFEDSPTDYLLLSVVAVPVVPGDFNGDGDVDGGDLVPFEACVSGPAVPYDLDCEYWDFDNDTDVDFSDFGVFQRCYSGEGVFGDPTCAE